MGGQREAPGLDSTLDPGRTMATPTPSKRLTGVLAPVLTPFRADLSPDPARLVAHCRWLLEHGCVGLAPFGTTSEANSLSVEERERLLEALLDAGVPADRLVPGTGCCALPDTVRLTAHAVRREVRPEGREDGGEDAAEATLLLTLRSGT